MTMYEKIEQVKESIVNLTVDIIKQEIPQVEPQLITKELEDSFYFNHSVDSILRKLMLIHTEV